MAWSGVDLFFVLSGFLIGGILCDARTSPRYFQVFYLRRALRILPLYYTLVFLMYLVASVPSLSQTNWGWIFAATNVPQWAFVFFMQNFWVAAGGSAPCVLNACWSLAVEEQFYLTLPPAVRYLSQKALVVTVGGLCLLAPLCRLWCWLHGAQWGMGILVLLPCRADALGVGVLAAIALRRPGSLDWLRARQTGLLVTTALLFVLAVTINRYTMIDGLNPINAGVAVSYSFLAIFYVSLLLCALVSPMVGRALRTWPLTHAGLLCYGLYLIHLPMRELVLCWWADPRDPWGGLRIGLLALPLTWALSLVCWHGFEKRFVFLGHGFRYEPGERLDPAKGT